MVHTAWYENRGEMAKGYFLLLGVWTKTASVPDVVSLEGF